MVNKETNTGNSKKTNKNKKNKNNRNNRNKIESEKFKQEIQDLKFKFNLSKKVIKESKARVKDLQYI